MRYFIQAPDWTNVEITSFYSPSRDQEIRFAIYTPPGYQDSTDRYPVLYFLHGIGGDHMMYWRQISSSVPEAKGDAGAWISQLIRSGLIPPMIIVTPHAARVHWDENNESMVTEDLIDYVDSHWRTIPTRQGRAIEGFSMGGSGANRYAARHPDTYSSTVIMADPRLEPLLQYWEANLDTILGDRMGVYLAVGETDRPRTRFMTEFSEALTGLGVPHEFEIVPVIGHNFGELYNEVGLESLQFHGKYFSQSSLPDPRHRYMPTVSRWSRPY
jgi:enterochelin esterase-like enzyme